MLAFPQRGSMKARFSTPHDGPTSPLLGPTKQELDMLPAPFKALFDTSPTELEMLVTINERLKTIEHLLRLQTWQKIPPLEDYLLTLRKRKGG